MAIIQYWLETPSGCCSRVTIMGLDVTDHKAKGVRVSQHNQRAVAERKLAKLIAALPVQPST